MGNKKLRMLVLTGIKSEYDILYPVLCELKKRNHDLMIVVSGAHLSDQHNNTYKRILQDGFEITDKIDTLLPEPIPNDRNPKAISFTVIRIS